MEHERAGLWVGEERRAKASNHCQGDIRPIWPTPPLSSSAPSSFSSLDVHPHPHPRSHTHPHSHTTPPPPHTHTHPSLSPTPNPPDPPGPRTAAAARPRRRGRCRSACRTRCTTTCSAARSLAGAGGEMGREESTCVCCGWVGVGVGVYGCSVGVGGRLGRRKRRGPRRKGAGWAIYTPIFPPNNKLSRPAPSWLLMRPGDGEA